MKKLLSLFLVLTSFTFADISDILGDLDDDDEEEFTPCAKTYIQPTQVFIIENAILVNFNNLYLETNGLLTDGEGIYIEKYRMKAVADDETWQCPSCLMRNPIEAIWCESCGK